MPDPTKRKIRMIHVPFDYEHPDRSVSCITAKGVIEVDRTIADAAIKAGVASPIAMPRRAPAKRKSYRKPASTKSTSSAKPDNDAANTTKSDDVDRKDLAADGGTDGGKAVDINAE